LESIRSSTGPDEKETLERNPTERVYPSPERFPKKGFPIEDTIDPLELFDATEPELSEEEVTVCPQATLTRKNPRRTQ
jgi:hypothetical protein